MYVVLTLLYEFRHLYLCTWRLLSDPVTRKGTVDAAHLYIPDAVHNTIPVCAMYTRCIPFLPLHSNVKSQNKYKKKRRLKTKQYGNVVCDALISRIVGAYIYVVVVRSDRQPYF